MFTSLDKKFQIVGWLVTHGGKCCVHTKRMFCQIFRIFEKKLAEGSAYLVYNWIKVFILGTKTHLYELICHPHIEEDQTKPVCFMKKNPFDQELDQETWLCQTHLEKKGRQVRVKTVIRPSH